MYVVVADFNDDDFLLSLDCFEELYRRGDLRRAGDFLLSLDCFEAVLRGGAAPVEPPFYYLLIASATVTVGKLARLVEAFLLSLDCFLPK